MDTLWNIIAQIAFELPPDRMSLITEKISVLPSVQDINRIRKTWGVNFDQPLYERFVKAILNHPDMTGCELAAAFNAAKASVQYSKNNGTSELLWTGPTTSSVAIRHTEQALCELISAATEKIFIVSFVVYKADNIIAALDNAQNKNVEINFLLEASQDNGGTVSIDSFRQLKERLSNAFFYSWDNKKTGKAAVHAKCVLADESMALITSANLTGKAMEDNMEIGTLIKGGNLPEQLSKHLAALVDEKIIVPIGL